MRTLNDYFLQVNMVDVSTAGSVYVVAPDAGKIIKIYSALSGAIGTANAGITTKVDTVAVTGGAITIATASSASGDVDTAVPTANNNVSDGSIIEIITDGASTNTVPVEFTIVIRR